MEQIDISTHDIKNHVLFLEAAVLDNMHAIDHKKFSDYKKHRESISTFEKLFKELK